MDTPEHTAFFSQLEAVAAGVHDGRSLLLSDGHIGSRMVYAHELTHGRIFQESLDGLLHLCVLTALEHEGFADDHAELAQLNSFLFASTRDAHEKLATYLGIQSLDTAADITAAVRTLPGAYLDYYSFFDDKLKGLSSSYIRYLLAWSAGRLAFSSGRTSALDADNLLHSVSASEGPTGRLDAIGSFLASLESKSLEEFVKACASRAFERSTYAPFDFMNDEEWEERLRVDPTPTQKFDSALLHELTLSLCRAVPMHEHVDTALDGYFAPISSRFFQRKVPLLIESDGTVVDYADALELASMSDSVGIVRPVVLRSRSFDKTTTFDWIAENAGGPTLISAVELPSSRGQYKLFLANGFGEGSSYADGSPSIISAVEFSEVLAHLHFCCKQKDVPIPPVFVFTEQSSPGEPELSGLSAPTGSKWLFWRPGLDLRPRGHLRCVAFYVGHPRWSGLIDRSQGTWTEVEATFGVPQDGQEFNLSAALIFPRQKDWIPHLRLMPTSAASLYHPLLETPRIKKRLRFSQWTKEGETIMHAAMAVWETLQRH